MAAPTGNTLIARGSRFRVHCLAGGGWRIGFTTRLGYRDFPPGDPATDAAFSAFATMTTADQIDAAAGDLMARGPMTRTRALGAVTTALSIALAAGQVRAAEHPNPCRYWRGYMPTRRPLFQRSESGPRLGQSTTWSRATMPAGASEGSG